LEVRYSKDGGFQVLNWPQFDYLSEAIDFIKTVQQLSSERRAGCGKLVDFTFSKLLTSSFNIGLSFATESSGLSLHINGSYTLSFAGAPLTGASIAFPSMVSIPLPSSTKLSDLGKYIDRALAGAATSFVQGLLNNGAAI